MYIRIVLCCVSFINVTVCSATIYIYIALVVFPYFVIIFFSKTLKKNITVSCQAEVIMGGKVEACAECTKKCLLVHRNKAKLSPVIHSFFKIMIGKDCSEILVCYFANFFHVLYIDLPFFFPIMYLKSHNFIVLLITLLALMKL